MPLVAGDTTRNYTDLCLKWDVILNGPGSEGPWPECIPALRDALGVSSKKINDLKRFCEIMEASDIVVLRIGTTDIFGVGIVVGDYEWRDKFCDVDGWSLQHVRRVRWLWKYQDDPMRFDRYTLRFGDAVQVMDSDVVEKWLTKLDIKEKALKRPIRNLPTFSSNVDRSLVDEEDFN